MPLEQSHEVRDADLHELIRLSGELSELSTDLKAKRQHCLTTLARLCHADKAVFVEFNEQPPAGVWQIELPSIQFLNTPDHERRQLARFYERNEPIDPVIAHISKIGAIVMVGRPGDFLTEQAWRSSRHYNMVRRPAGIAEQIYAHFRVSNIACGIGLHRRDERPFQRRELRLVEAFMRGAGRFLHAAPAPGRVIEAATLIDQAGLPPRLAAVLGRFLLGETEKQAAKYLGVTHHTVHSYAKQIYKRLDVSSRSELLAKFIPRPGGLNGDALE